MAECLSVEQYIVVFIIVVPLASCLTFLGFGFVIWLLQWLPSEINQKKGRT